MVNIAQLGRCSILQFLSFWALILFILINIPYTSARTFSLSPASVPAGPLNPPKMVQDVCKNTTNYRSCLGLLLRDPRTKSLSTKPRLQQRVIVAKVAFNLANRYVFDTEGIIIDLTNKSTTLDDRLDWCRSMYNFMGTDTNYAGAVVGEQDPTELNVFPRHDILYLNDCEKQYKPPQSSPLYRRNGHMRLLLEMALAITLIPI